MSSELRQRHVASGGRADKAGELVKEVVKEVVRDVAEVVQAPFATVQENALNDSEMIEETAGGIAGDEKSRHDAESDESSNGRDAADGASTSHDATDTKSTSSNGRDAGDGASTSHDAKDTKSTSSIAMSSNRAKREAETPKSPKHEGESSKGTKHEADDLSKGTIKETKKDKASAEAKTTASEATGEVAQERAKPPAGTEAAATANTGEDAGNTEEEVPLLQPRLAFTPEEKQKRMRIMLEALRDSKRERSGGSSWTPVFMIGTLVAGLVGLLFACMSVFIMYTLWAREQLGMCNMIAGGTSITGGFVLPSAMVTVTVVLHMYGERSAKQLIILPLSGMLLMLIGVSTHLYCTFTKTM